MEKIMLSEISETKKDKYSMISLICGLLKKSQVKKQNSGGQGKGGKGNWGDSPRAIGPRPH